MKLLGVSATFLFLLVASTNPAARSQASSAASETSYCDLIRNAASYHKKKVRVRAIYAVGFEISFLYDPAYRGKGADENRVWVEFGPSFEKSNAELVKKFDELLKPSSPRPDGSVDLVDARRVEVVFVGRFESDMAHDTYGHLGAYGYQMTAESVEDVKPVPKDASW